MDDDRYLINRAIAAYYRNATRTGAIPDQSSYEANSLVEHEGKQYVVLANSYRTLAVYRVRNDGMLKRLRRPPHDLAPDWYEEASEDQDEESR